jgi:hypothetical protein
VRASVSSARNCRSGGPGAGLQKARNRRNLQPAECPHRGHGCGPPHGLGRTPPDGPPVPEVPLPVTDSLPPAARIRRSSLCARQEAPGGRGSAAGLARPDSRRKMSKSLQYISYLEPLSYRGWVYRLRARFHPPASANAGQKLTGFPAFCARRTREPQRVPEPGGEKLREMGSTRAACNRRNTASGFSTDSHHLRGSARGFLSAF